VATRGGLTAQGWILAVSRSGEQDGSSADIDRNSDSYIFFGSSPLLLIMLFSGGLEILAFSKYDYCHGSHREYSWRSLGHRRYSDTERDQWVRYLLLIPSSKEGLILGRVKVHLSTRGRMSPLLKSCI
jgi:hypothetical protein